MIKQKQLEVIEEMDRKLLSILNSKGEDYASSEDRLGNFKRISMAAKILGVDVTTPHGYAMFMVLLKIDRVNNLINSGRTPNNEGIEDSFMDGVNYFKLSYCCYLDEKDEAIQVERQKRPTTEGLDIQATQTTPKG